MIPTLLLIGLPLGLLPRWWPLAGIVATGIFWTLLFAADDLLTGPVDAVFVFALGTVNLAGGAFLAWLVKRFVLAILQERQR